MLDGWSIRIAHSVTRNVSLNLDVAGLSNEVESGHVFCFSEAELLQIVTENHSAKELLKEYSEAGDSGWDRWSRRWNGVVIGPQRQHLFQFSHSDLRLDSLNLIANFAKDFLVSFSILGAKSQRVGFNCYEPKN